MSRAAAIDLRDFPRASDHAFVCAAKGAPMAESRSDLVLEVLRSWPAYAVTPLYAFESLASELRLGGIFYKDESSRFDLNSFKSLGAAYALSCEVARELGLSPGAAFEQLKEAIARRGAPFRVVCATDGNHGRAVAWAAFQLGLEATVLIHPGVSAEREEMIRAEGATVERVPGNYYDSVR